MLAMFLVIMCYACVLQTIQVLVEMEPCNSHALLLLGNTQLKLYENEANSANATQLLEEAKLSFLASISKEGKKAAGDPPEELVRKSLDHVTHF